MNAVFWLLVGWSGAALLWWGIALGLVWRHGRTPSRPAAAGAGTLTIFKSLPGGAGPEERAALAGAIDSFMAQMAPGDQLLLGVPAEDLLPWQSAVARWQQPGTGHVEVICQPMPRQRANPKIAWYETLAPHARGDLWLWSDADIVAPADFLRDLRAALATGDGAVTCPYCVRAAASGAATLDAAFVNAEFLPGALLLGRLGSVGFAFGAATLFRAADFRARVSWDALGAALADDYALGQQLQPVRLGGPLVATLALETNWVGALRHYYRWQKTIRWCRPGSYAALLAITPLLGWAGWVGAQPGNPLAWLGLGGQWTAEAVAVHGLCRAVGCRLSGGAQAGLLLWPALRALVWLSVWLPVPVRWRGTRETWAKPNAAGGA